MKLKPKTKGKVKTQEDLETEYNKNVTFPSEIMMPVPRSGSELDHQWQGPLSTVDNLGRVNGKTYPELNDDLPDFLKATAVAKAKDTVRLVTLMKDDTLEYPYLGLSVFVAPDPAVHNDESRFARMFSRAMCTRAPSVLEADLVIFAGGSDVQPELYGAERHSSTWPSPKRDEEDMGLYLMCLEYGIPMLGICRGAQFLNVMNGGKLFQDVDSHQGDHPMWDILNGKHIEKVSSVHHQMVVENIKGGMTIVATAARSHQRALDDNIVQVGTNADIEAFFYRETCCLGIQGHPEYEGYSFFRVWCLKIINDLIYCNQDLEWRDRQLRMKKSVMQERKLLSKAIELPKAKG